MNSFQLQYISSQLAFEYSDLPVSVLDLLQKNVCLAAVHLQVPAFMVQFLGLMTSIKSFMMTASEVWSGSVGLRQFPIMAISRLVTRCELVGLYIGLVPLLY